MYETETNSKTESLSELPPEVAAAFRDLDGKVSSRTLIPWGEHCTECVWPTCYSTCELYAPKEETWWCRRFVEGMVRIECDGSVNGYLLKISFKRWATLSSRGNFRLHSPTDADRLERRDFRIGRMVQRLPLSKELKQTAATKRFALKKRLASRGAEDGPPPTNFLFECYNPNAEPVRFSLTIRSLHSDLSPRLANIVQLAPGFRSARDLRQSKIPFQSLITVNPGFQRVRIPFEEISRVVDLHAPFDIAITPNEVPEGTTLYFGALDFVQETQQQAQQKAPKADKIKCIVWDLDGTLWEGVLLEDGPEKLRLRSGMVELIKELDQRGILHSVASKNNYDEAMGAIKRFGLEEYFLYPQVSWQPKSESVKAIATALNIGIDSLLFIDDSQFELQEVQTACSGVRVMHAATYAELPDMDACKVAVTAESHSRRKLYQLESSRRAAADSFGEDYLSFLRHCEIQLRISRLSEENLERAHELATRTNQMNFSGNRYDRDVLRAIIGTPHLDTYVIACEDRFGSYGVIGFSVVDRREPRMTDLMFSCRIQTKRVEHAFLAFVIRKYFAESGNDFLASYRKTEKNAPSGRVFDDLGMQEVEKVDGVSLLRFARSQTPPDDGIIRIEVVDNAPTAG